MQDTFYISEDIVLRTHTSPVQVRVMEKKKPPLRFIAPGKVYRCDADVTHSPMFHQVEGLMVDKDITFSHLKGVLIAFIHQMFGPDIPVRFRPSYFPFTEPSAEIDMGCILCKSAGCRVCKGTGWLEILGAGMVNPKVLENVGYDSEEYTGFAFGMGIERITLLKYSIDDIRLLFENDIRFLRQF
jgi:phenylalanyl-tRNA synthetase alpha chain